MKILSAEQIRAIDERTISEEGIFSYDLMERAANAFYEWFLINYPDQTLLISVISGVGNNGGDGLIIAKLLKSVGYKVKVYIVEYSTRYSDDCIHNINRLISENISFEKLTTQDSLPDFHDYDLLIDSIFGTGLNREPDGIAYDIIQKMNDSDKPIISVDVPSGLFLEKKTTFAVRANETVTFQIPKLALFLPENYIFTGNVNIVSIGLSEKSIYETDTVLFYTTKKEISPLIKHLSKFAHKGTQGHALIIGGSFGKCGSVCLAAKSALRTGCGLVTVYVPMKCVSAIQSSFPEAMAIGDQNEDFISNINFNIQPDAIGIGIGNGQHEKTQKAFKGFLQTNDVPLVVDADGINILSQNLNWLKEVPPNSILTPHPKELERLIGDWSDDFDKIDKSMKFAKKYKLIIVIKGAYSIILDGNNLYVNSSGTPALATAGSGDVLTGIITSLLAQGYSSINATRIGVYLHGLTASITKNDIHPRSFIATDIIDNIGNAYFEIEK